MPDSLLFAGGSNIRQFSEGNFAGTGAISVAVICKRTGDDGSSFGWLFRTSPSNDIVFGTSESGSGATLKTYNAGVERTADPTVDVLNDEWYLLGYSKASGTVTPRYHVYRYSTSTWEHGVFNGTVANFGTPTDLHWAHLGTEAFVGNLLIGAVWDSELADATFETLELDKASWVAAAPDEAYRFDTAGTITPFVGTGAQTVSNGGTLDTGDAPAGWTDEAAETTDTFSIAAATDDGAGSKTATSWAGVPGASYSVNDADEGVIAKYLWGGVNFAVSNAFLRFDTSAIPSGATILSANLLLYVIDWEDSSDDVEYAADFYDFGGEPSVDADWELSSSGDAISSIDPDLLTEGVVNTIALTGLSGIMRSGEVNGQGNTGITGIRLAPDNATSPVSGVSNWVVFATYEHASQEPRLEVTYTVGEEEAAGVMWLGTL